MKLLHLNLIFSVPFVGSVRYLIEPDDETKGSNNAVEEGYFKKNRAATPKK